MVIFVALVVTAVAFFTSNALGTISMILTFLCIFFFRDPERVTPQVENAVVSPADGIVQQITDVSPPAELDVPHTVMRRISIFLSVFDVHVNRVPVSGIVKTLVYRPGKFINASLDKASEDNERETILLEADYEHTTIVVTQIAGLIARRIVCDLYEASKVTVGERFGIIKFGSRVDVYVPKTATVNVSIGQRMVGGETIIATLARDHTLYESEIPIEGVAAEANIYVSLLDEAQQGK